MWRFLIIPELSRIQQNETNLMSHFSEIRNQSQSSGSISTVWRKNRKRWNERNPHGKIPIVADMLEYKVCCIRRRSTSDSPDPAAAFGGAIVLIEWAVQRPKRFTQFEISLGASTRAARFWSQRNVEKARHFRICRGGSAYHDRLCCALDAMMERTRNEIEKGRTEIGWKRANNRALLLQINTNRAVILEERTQAAWLWLDAEASVTKPGQVEFESSDRLESDLECPIDLRVRPHIPSAPSRLSGSSNRLD